MNKNIDEKILDFLNEAEKKKQKKDITSGPIKISNRYYEFEQMKFYEERVLLYIPKDFKDMPLEARKLKYPSEGRPEIIKCNEDGSITFTLNIIDSPLTEDKVCELKDGMIMIIKKTNPANVFYEDGILEANEKNIGYFEFKSSAIDDFLYNFMFFLEFEEKTIMGTFSCRYGEYKEWRDVIFEVLKRARVIREE